ncbi:MAG: diguanylate cyclase [Thermodesulfobacteriota bacterium]|nr:diguanylate cyclase [Thermodesulfobacteriota bacterium]
MKPVNEYIERHYNKFRTLLTISGFIITLFIGIIRFMTGPEFALSLFYLFPICFVTWFAGRFAGILISILSAVTWLIADLTMMDSFSHPSVPYLNETFRLIVFLIITFVVATLKKALEREKISARTDSLTQIANRRAFYELAGIEIERSRRYKYPFTMVSMDVDNFKGINDNFGHKEGDNLLCNVANILKEHTRASDIVSRLGGDEFVILLPETGAEAAYSVVKKIQKELLTVVQNNEWPVTFSFGVVTFNNAPVTIDEPLKKADNLMYSAKQSNKNVIRHEVMND